MIYIVIVLALALAIAGAFAWRAHRRADQLKRATEGRAAVESGRFEVRYTKRGASSPTPFHKGDLGARARDVFEGVRVSSIPWSVLEFVDRGVVRTRLERP